MLLGTWNAYIDHAAFASFIGNSNSIALEHWTLLQNIHYMFIWAYQIKIIIINFHGEIFQVVIIFFVSSSSSSNRWYDMIWNFVCNRSLNHYSLFAVHIQTTTTYYPWNLKKKPTNISLFLKLKYCFYDSPKTKNI